MHDVRSTISLFSLSMVAVAVAGAFTLRAVNPLVKVGPDRSPGAGGQGPVLVELFTSEGCSSCPPADELLIDIEKTPRVANADVIVLSEHVDYWNRLGWTDPYSSASFGERQHLYASRFGTASVYTPQMVVDGREELVGSDRVPALRAIGEAARRPKANVILTLAPRRTTAATDPIPLTVSIEKVPNIPAGETAEVFLAITEGGLHSQVLQGENSGRRLNHTAVVRSLSTFGSVASGQNVFSARATVRLEPDWQQGHLKAVVFVQERKSGHVLGAAAIPLATEGALP